MKANHDPMRLRVGDDGWMFLGDHYQHEFSQALGLHAPAPGHIERQALAIARIARFCARRGVRLLPVLVPAKAAIYLDKSGMSRKARPQDSLRARLLAQLQEMGLDALDLAPALRAARATAETYSPLNSHWTDFGAWVAWGEIVAWARKAETSLDLLGKLDFSGVRRTNEGNEMAALFGVEGDNPWTAPIFARDPDPVTFRLSDGTDSPQNWSRPVRLSEAPIDVFNPGAANARACVVAMDSTAEALSPFVNRAFRHSLYRAHPFTGLESAGGLREAVEAASPVLALYVVTERYCLGEHDADGAWEALDSFETAPAAPCWRWPGGAPDDGLIVEGRHRLDKPNLVRLPKAPGPGVFMVRAEIVADDSTGVMAAYTLGGAASQIRQRIAPGRQTAHFTAPTQAEGGHFWIAQDGPGRSPTLLSMEMRFVPAA